MPVAPTYRCTGVRRNSAGAKHQFTSVDAATTVGEVVWKVLGWRPDMTQFDVEVLVWVRTHPPPPPPQRTLHCFLRVGVRFHVVRRKCTALVNILH